MQQKIWAGTIEISYFDRDKPTIPKNSFTVVTTWAGSADEFTQKCQKMLESHGWNLLGVEEASPVGIVKVYSEEVSEMLERTRLNPNAILYGTFYTYPVM
ncbi:MAG: hypothetical protein ACLPZF_24905 [Candidatus Acidiferrales bacterium]